jgi:hypothetical protein
VPPSAVPHNKHIANKLLGNEALINGISFIDALKTDRIGGMLAPFSAEFVYLSM